MRALVLLAMTLASGCASPAGGDDLGRELEAIVARSAGVGRVAVAFRSLGSGREVLVDADRPVHAASTMKVAVMIELFRRADRGAFDLDAPVPVVNRFTSVADGTPYPLAPADDSDDELYAAVGGERTLRELDRRMIVKSSNLATNVLIELLGPAAVQRTIESLGTTRMQVRRGVEDGAAFRKGIVNTATAHDLMVLLAAIAEGRAASPAACEAMLAVLRQQEHDDLIPRGLPPGTAVAHKTGWIIGILHDAAIVLPDDGRDYVLVVLTEGFAERATAAAAIADVAAAAHARR